MNIPARFPNKLKAAKPQSDKMAKDLAKVLAPKVGKDGLPLAFPKSSKK